MKIRPNKFDHGEILYQTSIDIPYDMKMMTLYDSLSHLGAESLIKTIKLMPAIFKEYKLQPNEGITYGMYIYINK